MVCDNVPFNSSRLKKFSQDWNFEVSYRSPNYSRSNGLPEKAVDISKKMLKKSLERGEDIELALLSYRNAPLKNMGYSPSQLLNSRMSKTKIPVSDELLQPKVCKNVIPKIQAKLSAYESYYNETAQDLSVIKRDTDVTVYNHIKKCWEPGKVLQLHDTPRSYNVLDSTGNIVRRNRIDLKPSQNEFKVVQNDVENETTESVIIPSVPTTSQSISFNSDNDASLKNIILINLKW